METTVQLRKRGVLTLPAEIRERYGFREGAVFRLIDLEGTIVLTSLVPIVPELAREIEKYRLDAGLSIDQLLQDLRSQRERYLREKYGSGNPG